MHSFQYLECLKDVLLIKPLRYIMDWYHREWNENSSEEDGLFKFGFIKGPLSGFAILTNDPLNLS